MAVKFYFGISCIILIANYPVGYRFGGIALVSLINNGLSESNFFLMGHSLGAQLMGTAGRSAGEKGYTISKIIGLDPAGPGFDSGLPALDTSCAATVIMVHTDPNGLGSSEAKGDVDYFANYNSTYTMQPGCTERANLLVLNNETTCSHDYSWRLICASVEYAYLLEAEYATNGTAWLDGLGNPNDISYISIEPTSGSSGSYFLSTVAEYPYGLGEDGIYPPN